MASPLVPLLVWVGLHLPVQRDEREEEEDAEPVVRLNHHADGVEVKTSGRRILSPARQL